MVKIAKFTGYLVFFLAALIYFIPKVSLYYFAESKLEPLSVIIDGESADDKGFYLSIKDASVTFKDIESATFKEASICIFGVYNKVSIGDIKLTSTAESFMPLDIKSVDIKYSVFNPLNITADAVGGFGDADLRLDLLEKKIYLNLQPSKLMDTKYKQTLSNLKKSKDGGYEYAKTF